jgi:hypothetical protein|nr:hypothetical protein [Neorhizobium tomejilense]
MRTTVKFPALMVAVPQRHKNPKIALGAFDTVVEIPEVADGEFPVAISHQQGERTVEHRFSDGKLYLKSGRSIERILQNHSVNVLDSRSWNATTGAILRDMRRAVEHISDYENQYFWPTDAKRMLASGMNTEWKEVKQVIDESHGLRMSGPWLEKARATARLAPFLTEDQDARLARYERMTKDVFSSMRALDGEVWMPAAEPCYVAQTMPEGYGRCMAGSFELHAVTGDNDEDRRSWWNHLGDRAISILERDHLIENMMGLNKDLVEYRVHIAEALTADIPALELDRCARVLVNTVSGNAAYKSASFHLPSTATAEAFTSLVALTRSYDPFDRVPEELEDAVQALVSAVEACEADHHLISERDRRFTEGYLERWADRVVDFEMNTGMRL